MHALSWLLLGFWAVALVNTFLNLLVFRKPRAAALEREPFVSIIIPARDEERAIERSVRALLAQEYTAFEVIVVDDRSTDSTGAILERIAADNPLLIVVHNEDPPAGWIGKPWALHNGSLRASGELLLFVDADVYYSPAALRTAVAHHESKEVAMTALLPHFVMEGLWENAAMPNLALSLFSAPIWLGELIPHWVFGIGAGTGNLIRRSTYDAVGGHEALSNAVIDDVGLGQHVRRSGHRTTMVRTETLVSVRMYHGFGEVVRGFTKNAFALVGHRFIGSAIALVVFLTLQAMPLFLALSGDRVAMVTVALIVACRVVLFAALEYPLWSALLLHPFMVFIWTWIMVRSTWIVGIRRKLSWRGRTYDPASTRFGADR